MDEATHLILPVIYREVEKDVEAGNVSGQMFRDSIIERWFPHYGRPNIIRADPDSGFISRETIDFFAEMKVLIWPCAGDAHWQISAVERAIQTLKTVATRAALLLDVDVPSSVLWAL